MGEMGFSVCTQCSVRPVGMNVIQIINNTEAWMNCIIKGTKALVRPYGTLFMASAFGKKF